VLAGETGATRQIGQTCCPIMVTFAQIQTVGQADKRSFTSTV